MPLITLNPTVKSYTIKTITLPSIEEIQENYVHNYGAFLPSSDQVGDVFYFLKVKVVKLYGYKI